VSTRSLSIVHAIARLNVGGAALNLLGLAAEQRRRGHDVVVVAGSLAEGEASMEYVATELGVPVLHVPALQRELSLRHDLSAIRALHRTIATRRPDILHTHTAKAGATGRIAATLSGAARPQAIVHTFHGHVLRGYFGRFRERAFIRAEWLLARGTNAVIAVSDEVRDDLVELGVAAPDKISVIPYGFDLSALGRPTDEDRARGRAEVGIGPETFVLGWAGRLTAIKRPEDLVRVLASLVDRGTDAALVAVGDGPDRASVETLAARLGVAERCHLVGFQQDMSHWYGLFDAFLLTSENEGTPVAAIEALASACPVVATNAGGTATVVRNGETGYIVPVGDTEALASHLADLAGNPGLARELGSRGAADVRERFAMAQMVDRVDDLYARLVASA
jgi:glycosyltransferase involved in cell wall biosynthesis